MGHDGSYPESGTLDQMVAILGRCLRPGMGINRTI
jgi:hypothetical protein